LSPVEEIAVQMYQAIGKYGHESNGRCASATPWENQNETKEKNALFSPINHLFPKLPCDLPLPLLFLSIVEDDYMRRIRLETDILG